MSVDWDRYELYDPGVSAPLSKVPRAEARRAYERCMQTKSARIEGLRTLLEANGVVLGHDDGSVQALNDWYVAEIEPEPDMPPGWLRPEWYTVSHDVEMFLGDLIIARHPNLRWEFHTWGKRCIDYQQHVIMGFTSESPRFKTNMNLERMIVGYGHRIIGSRGSIRAQGKFTIRGHEIDVDKILATRPDWEFASDEFVSYLRIAAKRNDGPPIDPRDWVKAILAPMPDQPPRRRRRVPSLSCFTWSAR